MFLINLSTTFKNLIDYYGRIFHYIIKLDNFEIIEISLLMFHFSFLQKVILHSQDFGLNIQYIDVDNIFYLLYYYLFSIRNLLVEKYDGGIK